MGRLGMTIRAISEALRISMPCTRSRALEKLENRALLTKLARTLD